MFLLTLITSSITTAAFSDDPGAGIGGRIGGSPLEGRTKTGPPGGRKGGTPKSDDGGPGDDGSSSGNVPPDVGGGTGDAGGGDDSGGSDPDAVPPGSAPPPPNEVPIGDNSGSIVLPPNGDGGVPLGDGPTRPSYDYSSKVPNVEGGGGGGQGVPFTSENDFQAISGSCSSIWLSKNAWPPTLSLIIFIMVVYFSTP
ncbi:OLC1v1009093C2 [Oldenlandia corymbosa var. corymbosa]|nr:OLC1v1009093C2 [Oldenlandia corymbosa var. corymbosa]